VKDLFDITADDLKEFKSAAGERYVHSTSFRVRSSVSAAPIFFAKGLKASGKLSRSITFQADGARTGNILLCGEEYFVNEKGVSAISYADYAIAMIDEIEKADHIQIYSAPFKTVFARSKSFNFSFLLQYKLCADHGKPFLNVEIFFRL